MNGYCFIVLIFFNKLREMTFHLTLTQLFITIQGKAIINIFMVKTLYILKFNIIYLNKLKS